MAYEKQEFIDYPNEGYTILKAHHLEHIENGVYNLDQALDAKEVEVEKTIYSTNRFDKNTIGFIKPMYISNRLPTNYQFKYQITTAGDMAAGSGWVNIPIQSGKIYTMKINPVTLTDFYNYKYGYFINLFFTDKNGILITNVSYGGNTYYYAIGSNDPDSTVLAETAYNINKIECKAYGSGSNTRKGMGTDAVTINIKDESIAFMHVQLGFVECKSPVYQLDTTKEFIQKKGGLTDEQAQSLINSFQINEGTEILEYEEGGDETIVVKEVQSNLTKIQNAFTEKIIPSSNLLDLKYVYNQKYILNGKLNNNGGPLITSSTTYPSALLKIPLSGVGNYFLTGYEKTIENGSFGYFGNPIFTDVDDVYVCGTYAYTSASGVEVGLDETKVSIAGVGTSNFSFTIKDDSIKYIYIPLLCYINGSANVYGLWVGYNITSGLTEEQINEIIYKSQLNKDKKQKWEAYNDTKTQMVILPEYIDGLEDFKEDINNTIQEGLDNIKKEEKSMVINLLENEIYIRAKNWKNNKDLVYSWHKENPRSNFECNKFLNMRGIYEINHDAEDNDISSLIAWKSAGDDITPVNFNSTYIGANHGYSCCSMATVEAHGKTEADIGSIWLLGDKTFVLISIPDENRLRLQHFNDTKMNSGNFGSWVSCTGTLIHKEGATNTDDIIVTESSMCQLYRSFNKYFVDVLVDGESIGIDAIGTYTGDRIDIITQYNIIYLPAMINYLIENVGNNTNESQFSEDITDYYITLYVDYQFNRNGSLSTYSSFYVNKQLSVGYFGLVQSIALSNPVYTYVPDTQSYQSLVEQTGASSQYFYKTDWTNSEKVPYRYYQFSSELADKGIALVYDRGIGWGENSKRLEHTGSSCGFCYTSRKLYPYFISGGILSPGEYFDGCAVRVPLYKYDEDFTSIGWYWINNDIILMIDAHKTINKEIILPIYMNNKKIEVLDKTDSCIFNQTFIFNNKIRFISNNEYSYLVLKLFD